MCRSRRRRLGQRRRSPQPSGLSPGFSCLTVTSPTMRRAPQRTKEALYPVGRDQRTAAVCEEHAEELHASGPRWCTGVQVVYETQPFGLATTTTSSETRLQLFARGVRFGHPNAPVPTESTLLSHEEARPHRPPTLPDRSKLLLRSCCPRAKRAPPPVLRNRRQTASELH
jgi:hypothetical protein